jgi:hypothetical protein
MPESEKEKKNGASREQAASPFEGSLYEAEQRRRQARFAGPAQERKLELSGTVSFDFFNSRTDVKPEGGGPPTGDRLSEIGVGLDLNASTYVLDPRFIKLSLGMSFSRNRGSYEEAKTHYGNTGTNFNLDFLPTSPYPLRFTYAKQGSDFRGEPGVAMDTARETIAFDWALKMPRFPSLNVHYDRSNYHTRYRSSLPFNSRSASLTANFADTHKGWSLNADYSRQATTEGTTNLQTDLNFVRLDARRQLFKKSSLFVNTFFERLHFAGDTARPEQNFSFFDVHSDLTTVFSKRLRTKLSHQFYYSASEQIVTAAAGQHSATPEGAAPSFGIVPTRGATSFNAVEGSVAYQLTNAISVGAAAAARLISPPDGSVENSDRHIDLSASVNWNKRIKSLDTRAGYMEGSTLVHSNFGAGRGVRYRSYSAGLSAGKTESLLVTADFNLSTRPDVFQTGGFLTQKSYSVGVESGALGSVRARASAGQTFLETLTTRGRERLRTGAYSLSLDHRRFTFLASHNTSAGLRDVYLVTLPSNSNRVFVVLPVGDLIRDPLLNTAGTYTFAILRLKPARNLDVELHCLKDRTEFVKANDVRTKQFNVLVRHKLGKTTVSGGALLYAQETESLHTKTRNYFYLRVSRSFAIF